MPDEDGSENATTAAAAEDEDEDEENEDEENEDVTPIAEKHHGEVEADEVNAPMVLAEQEPVGEDEAAVRHVADGGNEHHKTILTTTTTLRMTTLLLRMTTTTTTTTTTTVSIRIKTTKAHCQRRKGRNRPQNLGPCMNQPIRRRAVAVGPAVLFLL